MSSPLVSIAYVSVADPPMTDAEVAEILRTSRLNNDRDGITGALLYHRNRFIQIIEGPEPDVQRKYDVIAADPRHGNVQQMRRQTIAERQFPQWTMGFRASRTDVFLRLDGYEDFFNRRGADRLKHADNEAQQFLEWLGEYWLPRA